MKLRLKAGLGLAATVAACGGPPQAPPAAVVRNHEATSPPLGLHADIDTAGEGPVVVVIETTTTTTEAPAPVLALYREELRRTAELGLLLEQSELELAVCQAHLKNAREQADRALAIAAGGSWSADDVGWAAGLGIDVQR